MKFTKNEKRTLKLLLGDGRVSDTDIAEHLKITKQAVGKIRRKLEESGLITGYSTKIDFAKLGIDVFATETVAIVPHCGKEPIQCCSALLESPHVIKLNKLPEQNRFLAFYGFRNLAELEQFFKNGPEQNGASSHIQCFQHSPIKIFSGKSQLKDCPLGLLTKIVDEI